MSYNRSRVTLPANHHKEDAKWIESQLMAIPPAHQIKARAAYSDIYQQSYSNEPVKHKKLNTARKEANKRLRIYCKAVVDKIAEEKAVIRDAGISVDPRNFNW